MGVDKALIATVAAMVILVLLHQPLLALLAGLVGIIFVATSGDRYASFPDVEIPKAGDYPKWDFWKDTLKDAGEFLGGISKTFLHTEVGTKRLSNFMKKTVYNEEGGKTGIYMFGPYAMVLPNSFAEDMHKLSHISVYMNAISYLAQREKELTEAMSVAQDDEVKKLIKEELNAIQEAKKKLLEQMKKQAGD